MRICNQCIDAMKEYWAALMVCTEKLPKPAFNDNSHQLHVSAGPHGPYSVAWLWVT